MLRSLLPGPTNFTEPSGAVSSGAWQAYVGSLSGLAAKLSAAPRANVLSNSSRPNTPHFVSLTSGPSYRPNTSDTHPHTSIPDNPANVSAPATITNSDFISMYLFGMLLAACILVFSALPAAAIWRTAYLNTPSYTYVLILCAIDCVFGGSIFIYSNVVLLLHVSINGIPEIVCLAFESLINGCMNSVTLLMMLASRDRSLSVLHPLRYSALVNQEVVRRHLYITVACGLLQSILFTVARLVTSSGLLEIHDFCDTMSWLSSNTEQKMAAGFQVLYGLALDSITVYYNYNVLHCAWKIRNLEVNDAVNFNPVKEAQRRRHMKIFKFTFKLACLFLVCSLPYKLAVLLHNAAPQRVSEHAVRLMAFIRTMYHIVDGWTFCSNTEVLEALKAMLLGR